MSADGAVGQSESRMTRQLYRLMTQSVVLHLVYFQRTELIHVFYYLVTFLFCYFQHSALRTGF